MAQLRNHSISRRNFLTTVSATAGLSCHLSRAADPVSPDAKALIAITFDLEMAAGYPVKGKPRHTYPWDYEKGNLNKETKQYTVEACRQVKAKGGVLHSFLVGQVLEHPSVDWIREIIDEGHPVGNHTYDHVNVMATKLSELQHRFRRAPWLLSDKTLAQAIRENIRLCEVAMQQRLAIKPLGLRTPYAFGQGLDNRLDLQEMLLELGYTWVSSKYKGPSGVKTKDPTEADFAAFVATHQNHQPYIYPTGLIEIPFSPPMDVGAFRSRSWNLDEFLQLLERSVLWAIENRLTYDFGVHPSIMYVEDPEFKAVNLICDLVNAAGQDAKIVGLDKFADRAKLPGKNKKQG